MKSSYQLLVLFVALLSFSACAEMNEDEKVFRFNKSLKVDGISRTYILNLPPGYYADAAKLSLVIGLHGGGEEAGRSLKRVIVLRKKRIKQALLPFTLMVFRVTES
jgi:poly(3-hydroxybutyrate) depolymerase